MYIPAYSETRVLHDSIIFFSANTNPILFLQLSRRLSTILVHLLQELGWKVTTLGIGCYKYKYTHTHLAPLETSTSLRSLKKRLILIHLEITQKYSLFHLFGCLLSLVVGYVGPLENTHMAGALRA